MGRYFLRGRSPEGETTTERVLARDATAALDEMRARGFSEVELLSSAFETASVEDEETIAAADQAAMPFRGDWYPGWVIVKGAWFLWAPALVFLAYRLVYVRRFGWWDAVAIAVIVLVIGLATFAAASVLPYKRMLRAGAHGRWDEVLSRIEALERSRRYRSQIPPSELACRKAAALARLGREREAEEALLAAREDTSQPGWVLEARAGDHYAGLGDRERARAFFEAAVTQSPDIAETHLVLAEFLAGHLVRDPVAARESLRNALRFPLAESIRWAANRVEGMVLLEEGDAGGALAKLRLAREQFRRLADTGISVLADASIGVYLAFAHAALGDREAAARELDAAKTWLAPHGLDDLLDRCREAVRIA